MVKRKKTETQVADDKPVRVIPCPRCRKSTRYDPKSPYRPFCSPYCKDADIISWAEEDYKMAGEPADPNAEDL